MLNLPESSLGCWLWTEQVRADGYGVMYRHELGGHQVLAHRQAWRDAYGAIPDGMFVCHRCDVRNCVNPAHLFLGRPADNNADKVAKGRHYQPGVGLTCRRGHQKQMYGGKWQCRECRLEAARNARKGELKPWGRTRVLTLRMGGK